MPTVLRSIAIAFLALPILGGCATTITPMLPPEMHDQESYLRGFGEPPLWPGKSAVGYRRRLRLVIAPMVRQRVAIRIDTDLAGRTVGYFTRMERTEDSRGWEVSERQQRSVSAADLAALDRLIAVSKLWTIYPEYWQPRKDEVCIDGVEIIMERVTPDGYRFSEANAQCTAPPPMLEVAAQMIDIADNGDKQVAGWLH